MPKIGHFRHTDCFVVLKWKQGERNALSTHRHGPSRLHVLFDIPPAGDFDHELGKRLSPTEHLKLFGKRLYDAWGNHVTFIDAQAVDDDLHRAGLTRHPLTELLERARMAGALACPSVSLSHSNEYRLAVRRFIERNPELPICIRVEARHLDSSSFQMSLLALLQELNCEASRCLLLLDFKALDTPTLDAVDAFVETLVDRIAELPFIHSWRGFALAMSSFPIEVKLKPGNVEEYPRTDLLVYRKLISNPKDLLRTPMFGDYAVDTSQIRKPERRTPSAHFRYSTPTIYAISKGTTVKKPYGYGAIYPVADLLVSQPFFMGEHSSSGDRFIAGLKARPAKKGNAATWRWASTDHHLTSNLEIIARLYGLEKAPLVIQSQFEQIEMFALDSPSTAPVASPDHAEAAQLPIDEGSDETP